MDPVAFQIGNLVIRWYGIFYVVGFLFGYWVAPLLSRNISKKDMQDFFLYLIPFSIIGGRLAYVFLNWSFYSENLFQIIAVWNGGMAFHGGLIGAILAALYYCKKKNINFYDLADVLVIPLAIALALGRLGNYINGELFGKVTSLPWGVSFDGVEGLRHPTQIYESLGNLFTFFVVLRAYKLKKFRRGFIFWLFIFLYSFFRFFVEFLKDVEIYSGLTYGQWISLPLGIISLYMLNRLK